MSSAGQALDSLYRTGRHVRVRAAGFTAAIAQPLYQGYVEFVREFVPAGRCRSPRGRSTPLPRTSASNTSRTRPGRWVR
jgi:hypothetical protein